MELIKIVNARNVIDSLSDKCDISTHLAYWMTKFIINTENEYVFYTAELRKLFDKFATKKEGEEDTLFIPAENVADFDAAVDALNKTDVEDPGIRFNLLELSENLKLSMKQMYSLFDFIDEEK